MKAKIKSGHNILFSKGQSNKWNRIEDLMIDTIEGEVDIVFSGEVPKLEFENFCKNQLILKIK